MRAVTSSSVTIGTPTGPMPTYVAEPVSGGPWSGVVVVHDFTGMSHDLRRQAGWLASEGFIAAAPDLYHADSRLRCLRTIIHDLAAGRGPSFDDIAAVRDWLVGVDHDVVVYPTAGHGFLNDHDPADLTLLLRVLTRLSGTAYDPEAARDARRRIVTFFRPHLDGKDVSDR